MKRKFKLDYIFIGGLLVLGVILAFVLLAFKKDGARVEIRIDGEIISTFNLNEDIKYEIISNTGTNLLIIEDGKAYVKEASCPDGLCVNTGRISLSGQSIICLPNRVVVEIVGGKMQETDVMTGGRT